MQTQTPPSRDLLDAYYRRTHSLNGGGDDDNAPKKPPFNPLMVPRSFRDF